MSTISLVLPNDGDTADASDVNVPFNTIANVINGGLDSTNITDGGLTPADLMSGTGSTWAWQSWTPVWTNMTVAGSTVTAKYNQVGKIVHYRIAVVLAGGNAPTGSVTFTLPVTSVSYAGTSTLPVVGSVQYFISNAYAGYAVWTSTTTATLVVFNASGTYLTAANISGSVPSSFTNGSEIHVQGFFEAA